MDCRLEIWLSGHNITNLIIPCPLVPNKQELYFHAVREYNSQASIEGIQPIYLIGIALYCTASWSQMRRQFCNLMTDFILSIITLVIAIGTGEMVNNSILVYKLPELPKDEDVDVMSKDREMSIIAAASCERGIKSIKTAPKQFKVVWH